MTKIEEDIPKAMLLLREYRAQVYTMHIHPVASRIALKFVMLCDDEASKKKLSPEAEAETTRIAKELFDKANSKPIPKDSHADDNSPAFFHG